jgi:hypothetical protein
MRAPPTSEGCICFVLGAVEEALAICCIEHHK